MFREKFAVYTRVSTAGQADNTSPESQRDTCIRYGESQGWELLENGWFHDTVSGAKGRRDRTNLDKILSLVENKTVKHVIIKKVDRLSREQALLKELIKEIYLAGGKVSIADKGQTYQTYRACAKETKLESFFAEYEREGIIEKNWEGRINQFQKGSSIFKLPFGYVSKQDKNRREKFKLVEIEPTEAKQIREFLEHFTQSRNIKESLEYARERGFKTRMGKPFAHHIFRDTMELLERYNGQPFTETYTYYDETYTREFQYPQIISDSLYKAVKEAYHFKNKAEKSNFNGTRPYENLVTCLHCGSPAYIRHKLIKKQTKTYSVFLVGCINNRKQVGRNYRLKGQQGNPECGKSFRHTQITDSLLEFLDSAAEFGTVENYARELSRVIANITKLDKQIKARVSDRNLMDKQRSNIIKRLETLLEMDGSEFKSFAESQQEKLETFGKAISEYNSEIDAYTAEREHLITILSNAGLEITDELLEQFSEQREKILAENVSYVPVTNLDELATFNTGEINQKVKDNVSASVLPLTVQNLAKELAGGLQELREYVLAGEWETVNTLLYRLGIRFYVDFDFGEMRDGQTPQVHTVVTLGSNPITGEFENTSNKGLERDPITGEFQNTTKGHALHNIPMLREALEARGLRVMAPEIGAGRLL